MGLCLALLCKPPLERITSHFVILPRQNRLFFWGDLGALVGALVVLFLLVAGHQLGTYQGCIRNAQRDNIGCF